MERNVLEFDSAPPNLVNVPGLLARAVPGADTH